MGYFLTAIVFILIFSLLVLGHELGHFWAAKRVGIKVLEFGIGLPPRMWGIKKGETIYSINWIPFGGFVRLYGSEEAHADKRAMKSKRSFMNKPVRDRLKVVLAGVAMNFILAWLFLSVGFGIGIEPLIVDSQDLLTALEDGTIVNEPGFVVKSVEPDSWAEEAGLQPEDRIVSFLDLEIGSTQDVEALLRSGGIKPMQMTSYQAPLRVVREGKLVLIPDWPMTETELGLEFYDFLPLPRVAVRSVPAQNFTRGKLINFERGDVILKVDEQNVYNLMDLTRLMSQSGHLEYEVFRDGKIEKWNYRNTQLKTVIAKVLYDSPAYQAGFREGDVVLSINGKNVSSPMEVKEISQQSDLTRLDYVIERDGVTQRIPVEMDENKRIGIIISQLWNLGDMGLVFYETDLVASVKEVKDVKYPFYQAPVKALTEMKDLSVVTAKMFVGVVGNVFGKGQVPEGIAGPVGMAQLTHTFRQQGIMALLRFTAVLSLSLAVINILPLPALDGGRFLFIIIEVIRGKRNDARIEAAVHTIGIVFLIILMVAITYNDIVRWVMGG